MSRLTTALGRSVGVALAVGLVAGCPGPTATDGGVVDASAAVDLARAARLDLAVDAGGRDAGPGGDLALGPGRDAAPDGAACSLTSFVDGRWEMKVDRAWDGHSGNIMFPTDPLDEPNYQPVGGGPTYAVVVSAQTMQVAIDNGPMEGQRTMAGVQGAAYDLTAGTFAGGRFLVWCVAGGGLQAELTLYGSGRPIVKSERGALLSKP